MQLLSISGAFLLGALLLFGGCDNGGDALLEAPPGKHPFAGERHLAVGTDAASRVFDGRDSLATGTSGPLATKDNFAIITQFIEIEGGDDVGRIGISDPDVLDASTLLFESRAGNPVLAPDDNQVTWGEFSGAEGAVIVKCTGRGTHVVVHLSGLIPYGTYSIWNKLLDPQSGALIEQIGYREQGEKRTPTDALHSESAFRASASGEGHVSGMVRAGALTEIGDCMLDDVEALAYDWRVVGIYHINGTPDLDQEGTFVEQTGFVFETEIEEPPRDIR